MRSGTVRRYTTRSTRFVSALISWIIRLLNIEPWPQTISGGIGLSGSSRAVLMTIGRGFG